MRQNIVAKILPSSVIRTWLRKEQNHTENVGVESLNFGKVGEGGGFLSNNKNFLDKGTLIQLYFTHEVWEAFLGIHHIDLQSADVWAYRIFWQV